MTACDRAALGRMLDRDGFFGGAVGPTRSMAACPAFRRW